MILLKALNKKVIRNISLIFIQCFLFLTLSCGLDTFEVIEPPSKNIYPDYPDVLMSENDDIMVENFFFKFTTTEEVTYSEYSFKGTDIYYKIYDNKQIAKSQMINLVNLISNDEIISNDVESRLRNYGYVSLKHSGQTTETLIPSIGLNRTVEVRLNTYSDINPYIKLDNVSLGNNVYPIRNLSSNSVDKTFDFKKNSSESNSLPKNDDQDFNNNENSSVNKYYVVAFAAGVAKDIYFNNQISNLIYLGSISIDVQN